MPRKHSISSAVVVLVALVLGIGEAAWGGGLEIRIKEKATVEGENITLGDIATFHSGEDDRVPALRERTVASSPPPGRSLTLNSRFLIYRLSAVMDGDPVVRFKIPRNLVVHRKGQVVSVKKMTRIFKEWVYSHAPWPKELIKVDDVKVPGPVTLPMGRLVWDVRERTHGDFVGETALVMAFTVNGRRYRKVPVRGYIRVTRKVIKTARMIAKGEIFRSQDLLEVVESSGRVSKNHAATLSQVIGKRAKMRIRSGKIIHLGMVEVPPAVRKGDRVVIRAENGAIEITALGRVLEDARSGDQVRVVNVSSGKELFATVEGHGWVAVNF